VRLEPLRASQATHVLGELAHYEAKRTPSRPTLGAEAIATVIDLADRYVPYESFPGKAVRLADELCAATEARLGSGAPRATVTRPTSTRGSAVAPASPRSCCKTPRSCSSPTRSRACGGASSGRTRPSSASPSSWAWSRRLLEEDRSFRERLVIVGTGECAVPDGAFAVRV